MALTLDDLKLRAEVMEHLIERLADDKVNGLAFIDAAVRDKTNKKVTPAVRKNVMALAVGRRVLDVDDIPTKLCEEVCETWLKEAAWRERDLAADKGTQVHKLAEMLSQGEKVDIPPYLERHVNSWLAFVAYYQVEFLETEFTVFDLENGFAGCGDFIARFHTRPEWGVVLGDYKTSISGIWPDIALQLAAIKHAKFIARCKACAKNGPCKNGEHPRSALWEDTSVLPTIKSTVGVQITADGFHVVPVRAEEAHFNTFLSGINVALWKTIGESMALDKQSEPKVMVNA